MQSDVADVPISRRRLIRYGLLLGAAAVATGCQSSTTAGKPSARVPEETPAEIEPVAPITNTDACASRLHDICEPLLLYYLNHHRLPGRLEELRQVPGFETSLELTCPVSNKPYVYNPVGIMTPENKPRVILYDPAPSHSGMRWAVSILEPQDKGALVTKVIALPESNFTLKLPG